MRDYVCGGCGARGVRLYRDYQTFADVTRLLCTACTEKAQKHAFDPAEPFAIAWMVAALPVDDSFWGYTSAPRESLDWWRALPVTPAPADAAPPRCEHTERGRRCCRDAGHKGAHSLGPVIVPADAAPVPARTEFGARLRELRSWVEASGETGLTLDECGRGACCERVERETVAAVGDWLRSDAARRAARDALAPRGAMGQQVESEEAFRARDDAAVRVLAALVRLVKSEGVRRG